MRRALIPAVVVLTACGAALGDGSSAPKVLMIGIDGVRPDALRAAQAPNLHRLMREGAWSDRALTDVHTVSGPCWSSILTAVWHMLQTGELYHDLGADYYTRRNPDRLTKRLVRQLEALGHRVTLEAREVAV